MKDGGPAFPSFIPAKDGGVFMAEDGMSMRDYFAAAAITGFCAKSGGLIDSNNSARRAYDIADAMLRAREEEK